MHPCPRCLNDVPEGSPSCGLCGLQLTPLVEKSVDTSPPPGVPEHQDPPRRRVRGRGLLVGALALVVTGGAIAASSMLQGTASPAATPVAATPIPPPTPAPLSTTAAAADPTNPVGEFERETGCGAASKLVQNLAGVDVAFWGPNGVSSTLLSSSMPLLISTLDEIDSAGIPDEADPKEWHNAMISSREELNSAMGMGTDGVGTYEEFRSQRAPIMLSWLNRECGTFYGLPPKPQPYSAPASSATADTAPPSVMQQNFGISGTATFDHFSVEVKSTIWPPVRNPAFKVEVCALASVEPEGITQVSTKAWSLVTEDGATLNAQPSQRFSPPYPAKSPLRVGECVSGWLDFVSNGIVQPSSIIYSNSFGESASWTY